MKRCEECGEHEATAIVSYAHDCADGTHTSRTWNLCRACADTTDPRVAALKRDARREGFEREFAEMRSYFAELARTGDRSELAHRADLAARWLARVAATDLDITVPPDLVALTSRYRAPVSEHVLAADKNR